MTKRPEQRKEIAGGIIRKYITAEKVESFDDERSVVAYANKPTVDRDKELILSNAWHTEDYTKNPVLLMSHKYDLPSVGKVLWTKSDSNGLKFKAQFAPTDRGKEMYQLYKGGYMGAFSVGFTPMENGYVDNPSDPKYKGVKRLYKDVNLLEISCVSVPAHADALAEFVKSGKVVCKQLNDELEVIIEIEDIETKDGKCPVEGGTFGDDFDDHDECENCSKAGQCEETSKSIDGMIVKGAIAYKDLGIADEGESWDGAAANKADIDILKKICAWVDSSKPDDKGSYKLPHHNPSSLKAVWKGVAAAMAACKGARGGVDIPESDMPKVISHLSKHYKQFSKEVPKEFTPEMLKEIFPEETKKEFMISDEQMKELTEKLLSLQDQVKLLNDKIEEKAKKKDPKELTAIANEASKVANESGKPEDHQTAMDAHVAGKCYFGRSRI